MEDDIKALKEKLLNSHWPKCNELAEKIMMHKNEEAKEALIDILSKAKRHHVRTSAIKALTAFNDKTIVKFIEPLLDDPAYETRMEAKNSLKLLTGDEYLTGRGE